VELAHQTGLSLQKTRTCLDRLIECGCINKKSTNKYTLITICKYSDYQDLPEENNKQITNKQQTNNKQITTTSYKDSYKKNDKNDKNSNNDEVLYGEYQNVNLSKEHYGKLLNMCLSENLLNELINSFSVNIEVGKERPYKADLPNAHYERLKAYYSYRKKYPAKFREIQEDSWHSVIEEMRKASG
jgi:hypothetical protein